MSDAPSSNPVPTPRYETVIRMAAEQAQRWGHAHIGVEHLMLAILIEGDSVPAQVLSRRVALPDARADLEELMRTYERR